MLSWTNNRKQKIPKRAQRFLEEESLINSFKCFSPAETLTLGVTVPTRHHLSGVTEQLHCTPLISKGHLNVMLDHWQSITWSTLSLHCFSKFLGSYVTWNEANNSFHPRHQAAAQYLGTKFIFWCRTVHQTLIQAPPGRWMLTIRFFCDHVGNNC